MAYCNYKRGRVKEYKAIEELVNKGYLRENIIRSSGSHGLTDIVAWNAFQILFIQIKRIKTGKKFYPDPVEFNRFKNMVVPVNSSKYLWVYHDRRKGSPAYKEEIKI